VSAIQYRILPVSALMLLAVPAAALDMDWQQQALGAAAEFYLANLPEVCDPPASPLVSPLSFELQIGEESAARQALMVQLPCRTNGDSESFVFLTSDQHGVVNQQTFPKPVIEHGAATQFREGFEILNAVYDASSRTVVETEPLPGAGDTYTTTQWGYRDGRFHIMRFAVDATGDGQDNPQTLIENDIW